jgi:2-polyprenyl-6-methoxyphenol hydroxylase-like FAD-dependent oxidoreductase
MTKDLHDPQFRLIVIGGSVAELTLANSLSRQGIDFVLLEGRMELCHHLVVHWVSGLTERCYWTMGIFDDISQATKPVEAICTWRTDGKLLSELDTAKFCKLGYLSIPFTTNGSLSYFKNSHGYMSVWIERCLLLHMLFKHLREKEKPYLELRAGEYIVRMARA